MLATNFGILCSIWIVERAVNCLKIPDYTGIDYEIM